MPEFDGLCVLPDIGSIVLGVQIALVSVFPGSTRHSCLPAGYTNPSHLTNASDLHFGRYDADPTIDAWMLSTADILCVLAYAEPVIHEKQVDHRSPSCDRNLHTVQMTQIVQITQIVQMFSPPRCLEFQNG